MKKLHNVEYRYDIINSSSHHNLFLIASFQEIVDVLGNPTFVGSLDEKIQIEWVLFEELDVDYKVITIYDYKTRTSIYNIYECSPHS